MEIIVHDEDKVDPPLYETNFLHSKLTPPFSNRELNGGKYKIVAFTDEAIAVYFYHFERTTGASEASRDTLEMSGNHDVYDIQEILPKCEDVRFEPYKVPWKFLGEHDVVILIEQKRQEGRHILVREIRNHLPQDILTKLTDSMPIFQSSPSPVADTVESQHLAPSGQSSSLPVADPLELAPSESQISVRGMRIQEIKDWLFGLRNSLTTI